MAYQSRSQRNTQRVLRPLDCMKSRFPPTSMVRMASMQIPEQLGYRLSCWTVKGLRLSWFISGSRACIEG